MEMPFGKFKGTEVSELDDNYLWWLHKQDWVYGQLKDCLKAEIEERELTEEHFYAKKEFLKTVYNGIGYTATNDLFDPEEAYLRKMGLWDYEEDYDV